MNESMNARWLRWSLTAIAVLLGIIAVELSVLTGPFVPGANAQVPDTGLQIIQLLEAQKQTNVTLGQILKHLQTQRIKVEVVGTDKDSKRKSTQPSRAVNKN